MRNIFRRSTEFTKKHKHHHHLFLAVLALAVAGTGAYTFKQEIVQAATYIFTQTGWGVATPADSGACASASGTWDAGTSECHAVDPTNRLNWQTYTSASSTISIGANDISLLSASYSFTDDGSTTPGSPDSSGGGFSSGTYSATIATTTASGASVGLIGTSANTWSTMATTPLAIGYGGSLVYPGSGDYIYGYRGSNTKTFYRYSISTNTWDTTRADTPAAIATGPTYTGTILTYPGSGEFIYGYRGNGTAFYRYSTTTNMWESMAPALNAMYQGNALTSANGDIYGSQSQTLNKYSVAGNSWTPLGAMVVDTGGSLVYPGSGDFIYSFAPVNPRLRKYSISGGTWTNLTNPPGVTVSYGASIVYPGTGDYIYMYQGGTNAFYKFSTIASTWTTMAPAPGVITAGGSLVYPGTGNYIYGFQGGSTAFYRYSIANYYNSPGTFTSNTIDFARPTNFTTMSWTSTTPAGTSVAMQVRSSPTGDVGSWRTNNGSSDGWENCGNITNGGNMSAGNCVVDTDRYIQYRATLSNTGDTTATPTLDSVIINDTQYSANGGVLTSSKYNTGADKNLIKKITWTGSATSTDETIRFQVRTAPDVAGSPGTWSEWCGYSTTCNNLNYFYDSPIAGFGNGVDLASDHPLRSGENDQWFQYRVELASGGAVSPVLGSVDIQYVVNAAPTFDVDYPTTGAGGISVSQINDSGSADFGKVTISYRIRDTDTNCNGETPCGNATQGLVTPSFEYNIGAGWVPITTNLNAGATDPKTVDEVNYNTYTATWTASSTVTTDTSSAQIRVTVDDSEGANRYGTATKTNVTLDTTEPVINTFNVAASSTPGTVNLTISDSSSLQFRLCDDSGYTTGGCTDWAGITTATPTPVSKTLANNVNGRPEVYLQVRDAYGNTKTGSVTAPATPGTLVVADVANPDANYFGETLSWSVSAGATGGYKVWYATTTAENSTAPSTYTFLDNSATNVYTHSISPMASTSAYWYRVTAVSSTGDISNLSAVMDDGDIPDSFGTGTPDTSPPDITAIATSSVLSTSAVITITTNEIASGRVYYGTDTSNGVNCDNYTSSTPPSVLYSTSTVITLTGLTPATTYFFCVKASDPTGNPTGNPATGTDGGSFTTATGPTISNVTLQNLAGNSVTIMWDTATSSNSYVYYSTNSSLVDPVMVGSATMVSCTGSSCQHQVGLSGLTADTIYYYKVKSTDNDENSVTYPSSGSYPYFRTLADTTAPALVGDITTPVKSSTAVVIVWQTDEPASSQVNWGTASTSLLRFTVNDTTKSIYHVVTLSSGTLDTTAVSQELVASTPYFFTVKSSDLAAPPGNMMTSSVQSFTTAVDGAATITYVYIRPASGDEKDTIPPVVSNVVISDITPFSAVVKFSTDEDTDGFVKYGKDTTYGDAAGDEVWAKTHTIKLRGLTLGTEYHIKVSANDKAGNTGSSADQTFKTSFLSEDLKDLAKIENIEAFQKEIENTIESILPSLVPPFITKPIISDITESGAKISFKSNIKAFPVVVYAEEGVFDEAKDNPYTGEVSETTEKATNHEIALTGLKGNTKYHIQARGFSLPKVIGKSADVTFITKASKIAGSIVERRKDSFTVVWTTEQPTSSIVEYKDLKRGITGRKTDDAKKKSHSMKIENLPSGTAYEVNLSGITEQGNIAEAGSPLSVTTSTDTTPPTISGFKVDNALVPGRTDRIQTIVSWVTDEPGTSTAFYEEGAGTPGDTEELASKNEILDSYVTNHSVILPSLKPGTIYRLKVTSTDDSGNEGSFGPRTVITPKQTESITDIIFKNFEDSFKFLQKI